MEVGRRDFAKWRVPRSSSSFCWVCPREWENNFQDLAERARWIKSQVHCCTEARATLYTEPSRTIGLRSKCIELAAWLSLQQPLSAGTRLLFSQRATIKLQIYRARLLQSLAIKLKSETRLVCSEVKIKEEKYLADCPVPQVVSARRSTVRDAEINWSFKWHFFFYWE